MPAIHTEQGQGRSGGAWYPESSGPATANGAVGTNDAGVCVF